MLYQLKIFRNYICWQLTYGFDDMKRAKSMNKNDLSEIGITKLGHQKILFGM